MGLNSYHYPDDTFHTSGFIGQDAGVMEVDAVIQIYAVLSHG
jgi:hypothetical protein